MEEIQVRMRSAFGKAFIDPIDEKAKLFCELAGCKTLTRDQVDCIKKLGYSVRVVPEVAKEL